MTIIKNIDSLATTNLRRDALAITESALKAIKTSEVIARSVSLEDSVLRVKSNSYDLSEYNQVHLLGIGKCAIEAAQAMESLLGDRLSGGIVYGTKAEEKCPFIKLECLQGTHPLPSEENVKASESVIEYVDREVEGGDLVLVIISGGGSTLLCLPKPPHTCFAERDIVERLMHSGASIEETNTVRKHLSRLRGGNLAAHIYPAKTVSLIFSDVPGDDISFIASGPTVFDQTTKKDARDVLDKYQVVIKMDDKKIGLIETPKDQDKFSSVENHLVLSNQDALKTMKAEAEKLGYRAEIITSTLRGEAHQVGKEVASRLKTEKPKTCLLYGGETTVTVKNQAGKGGRNQELALASLQKIGEGELITAMASDGRDNCEVAGAIADVEIKKQARKLDLKIDNYLARHDSFNFFAQAGGQLVIGATGSNVSDLVIALRE